MKKILASAMLGTLLVAGFFFALDKDQSDLANLEREPTIFSVDNSNTF